ncbi:unnamed protein product [Mycena citricolor]|uniref:HMG box domain-containing protein n=1 Tax=Mycena citricolor TaxID=2018698 RepID=A0AAD2K2W1_9AGAR|nr:unnamed protein product [Mycena citricolor]
MADVDQRRKDMVAGLEAAAAAMRSSCASIESASLAMRQCAKLAEDFAASFQKSGGLLKGSKGDEDDDEHANGKRKRGTKKEKDPNAPKRPASSYLHFQNEVRKDLKERFPESTNTELLNMIKTQWQDMSEAQKAVYNDRVAKEKALYAAAKTAYDARSPEEVARADAEAAAAAAAKKKPRGRKPKTTAVAALSPTVVLASDEEESTESDQEDAPPIKRMAAAASSSVASDEEDEDEDEEEDEEDNQPPPKKTKKASPPPPARKSAVKEKDRKKKSKA